MPSMPYEHSRNVSLVVSGNLAAERHFEHIIQSKRTLEGVGRILPSFNDRVFCEWLLVSLLIVRATVPQQQVALAIGENRFRANDRE